jgi:hypothetical protein
VLKGCWKRFEGASLRFKIKEMYWEIRYAWQRAWKGYDFCDVCNLDYRFIEKMTLILRDFKENNIALFNDDERGILSEEETDKIIGDMIYYFENSDADAMLDPLYERDETSKSRFIYKKKPTFEQIIGCHKKADENLKEGLGLFTKYFNSLWF